MKNLRILAILGLASLCFGCKQNKANKEVIIDEAIDSSIVDSRTVSEMPRVSDTYFSDALAALKVDNKAVASMEIVKGIDALAEEGKNVVGQSKVNLDVAIDQLRNIASRLDEGLDVSKQGYKEAVANAEINIAHGYLATEDVYRIVPKDNLNDVKLHTALAIGLKNLEEGSSKLEGDAKTEAEKLEKEGKQLQQDYEAWQKRAETQLEKLKAHFKAYQPEYDGSLDMYPKA